jgi:chemotaxis protein MotA
MNLMLRTLFILGPFLFVLSVFKGVGLDMLLNTNALLIIFGGTIAALFVGFPAARIGDTLHTVIDAFRDKRDAQSTIKDILDIARTYRKGDIRNLEKNRETIDDPFLRLGINLLISHSHSDDIRNIMEREMGARIVNFNLSLNILKTIARLAPSLGLAGTIISLVQMFRNLQSVDAMGPAMSIALMSTFYGVVISNLFALPLCAKLREKAIVSETLMLMTIEGILAIENREHPLRIEDRLTGYRGVDKARISVIKDKLSAEADAVVCRNG